MTRTCKDCGEQFETLTRLRRHDCPGPTEFTATHIERIVAETKTGLERGDSVSLPHRPLAPDLVASLEASEDVHVATPVRFGPTGQEAAERIALQTVAGGYILEFLPAEGWIVARRTTAEGKTDDQVADELEALIDEWEATITDLVLEYAGGADTRRRVREELGLE